MPRRVFIILSLLLLLLFSSCTREQSSLALVSNDEAEISIVSGDLSIYLILDHKISARLCAISGLSTSDMVKELVPDAVVFSISSEEYRNRDEFVSLLMSQGDRNRVDVLVENEKALQKSKLLSSMDEYSKGYDSALLEQVSDVEKTYQYELSSILYNADDWEEAKNFFIEWKRSIIR